MKRRTLYTGLGVLIATTLAAILVLSQGGNESTDRVVTNSAIEITMYRTDTCGCCIEYEKYLKSNGVEVRTIVVSQAELLSITRKQGIPSELLSCHTSIVEGYFVEGHVPLEAISKLLRERPAVDGIALPGMPAGSPGMRGTSKGPLLIYAASGDTVSIFMEI